MQKERLLEIIHTEAMLDAEAIGIRDASFIHEQFMDTHHGLNLLPDDEFPGVVLDLIKDTVSSLRDHVDIHYKFHRDEGRYPAHSDKGKDCIRMLYLDPIAWKYNNAAMTVRLKDSTAEAVSLIPSYKRSILSQIGDHTCVFDAKEIELINRKIGRMLAKPEIEMKAGMPPGSVVIGFDGDVPIYIPYQDQNTEESLRDWSVLTRKDILRLTGGLPPVSLF